MSSSSPPTIEQHRRLARHNFALAESLRDRLSDQPQSVPWAVVLLFYASLHATSAYVLKKYSVRTNSHSDRLQWFTRYPELRSYRTAYAWLTKQAHTARYYVPDWTWANYEEAKRRADPMDALSG